MSRSSVQIHLYAQILILANFKIFVMPNFRVTSASSHPTLMARLRAFLKHTFSMARNSNSSLVFLSYLKALTFLRSVTHLKESWSVPSLTEAFGYGRCPATRRTQSPALTLTMEIPLLPAHQFILYRSSLTTS